MTLQTDLDRLMNKKKLTARELGQLCYTDTMLALATNTEKHLTGEDVATLEFTALKRREDFIPYNTYRKMLAVAVTIFQQNEYSYMAIDRAINKIYYSLVCAGKTEHSLRREATSYPLIVTPETAAAARDYAERKIKERRYTLQTVLLRILKECWGKDGRLLDVTAPLKAALLDAKKLPARRSRIRAGFTTWTHQGCEVLPTGERSDRYNPGTWQLMRDQFLSTFRDPSETGWHIALQGAARVYQLAKAAGIKLPEGLTDEDIDRAYIEIVESTGIPSDTSREIGRVLAGALPFEAAPCPEDLTVYDVLKGAAHAAYYDHIDELQEDAPAVFGALAAMMAAAAPVTATLTPAQYSTATVKGGEVPNPSSFAGGGGLSLTDIALIVCEMQHDAGKLDGEDYYVAKTRAATCGMAIGAEDSLTINLQWEDLTLPCSLKSAGDDLDIIDSYKDDIVENVLILRESAITADIFERLYKVDGSPLKRYDILLGEIKKLNDLAAYVYRNVFGSTEERLKKRAHLRRQIVYLTDDIYKAIDLDVFKRYEKRLRAIPKTQEYDDLSANAVFMAALKKEPV